MSKCTVITGIMAVCCLFLLAAPGTDCQTDLLQGKVKSVTTGDYTGKYNQQGYRESTTSGGKTYVRKALLMK